MLKVLFFIQGYEVPSARFRVLQYCDLFKQKGIESRVVACSPPFSSEPKYCRISLVYHFRNVLKALSYVKGLLAAEQYDVVFVQRELTLYSWTLFEKYLGRRHRPAFVFDFDDSIQLLYDNPDKAYGKIPKILKAATLVIAGNSYLANYAQQFQPNVCVLPIPVRVKQDTAGMDARLKRLREYKLGAPYTIGWSGTRSNLPYLKLLAPAMSAIKEKYPFVRFHIMSNFETGKLPVLPFEYQYTLWTAEHEDEVIRSFDCGVMPLVDDNWTRGKCAFKLLLYMSHLVPSVASPVGMNLEVIHPDSTGLLAGNEDEWFSCFERLIENPDLSASLAANAFQQIKANYTVDCCMSKLVEYLYEAVDLKQKNCRNMFGGEQLPLNK